MEDLETSISNQDTNRRSKSDVSFSFREYNNIGRAFLVIVMASGLFHLVTVSMDFMKGMMKRRSRECMDWYGIRP